MGSSSSTSKIQDSARWSKAKRLESNLLWQLIIFFDWALLILGTFWDIPVGCTKETAILGAAIRSRDVHRIVVEKILPIFIVSMQQSLSRLLVFLTLSLSLNGNERGRVDDKMILRSNEDVVLSQHWTFRGDKNLGKKIQKKRKMSYTTQNAFWVMSWISAGSADFLGRKRRKTRLAHDVFVRFVLSQFLVWHQPTCSNVKWLEKR